MPPNDKCHGALAENVYSIDTHTSLQHPEENPLTVPLIVALLKDHFNKRNTFMVNDLTD